MRLTGAVSVARIGRAALLAGVAGLGPLVACGPPDSVGRRGDAGAAVLDSPSAGVQEPESGQAMPGPVETNSVGSRSNRSTGLENFVLPSDPRLETTIDTIPVEIENVAGVAIVVSASAGAGAVVLDTLDPGERYRVDIVGPTAAIELVWRDVDGAGAGRSPLAAATPGSVTPIQLGLAGPR